MGLVDDRLAAALALPGMFDDVEAFKRGVVTREQMEAEGFRIAMMHAVVFNTEPGKKLLQHWIKVFIARPIVRPGDTQFQVGIREGQADVIRQILANIETANNLPGEQA